MSAFDLYLVIFFVLCFAVAWGMHRLKKTVFKKRLDKPDAYKIPWKWFLPVLGFNYLILLPSLVTDPSCFFERTIGRYPLGKDPTMFWLAIGSPLLLAYIFQKNDNASLSSSVSTVSKCGMAFVNFAAAVCISFFILITAGNSLFSSSWPCTTKEEMNAQERHLERQR